MIVVVGTFRLPVDQLEAGREALIRVIEATRAEPGCLEYAYAEDLSEPGLIRVSEKWATRANLAAHFKAAHMKEWQRVRTELGMHERDMTAYTVGETEPL